MTVRERLSTWWTKLRGWRTIAFGILLASLPYTIEPLSTLASMDLKPIFKDHAEQIAAWIGFVVVVLRILTASGIGSNSTKVEG